MTIEKIYNYLVINKEYYSVEMNKNGSPEFKKVNKKEVEQKIKKAKEIAHALKDGIDGEKILTETLMINLQDKDFERLYKQTFQTKRKYKPKTREHHCVDMKVGNFIIPIVN